MNVIVASKNPVKIAASKRAFITRFPNENITFTSSNTDSGVSDQPKTTQETVQGAINRAKNAQTEDADYTIGLEGGLNQIEIDGRTHNVETSWACVLDCKTGICELAAGPSFSVLPAIMQHIDAGQNLSQAMASEFGIADIGKANGYVGWLTEDVIDREVLCFDGVYLALCTLLKVQT